MGWPVELNYNLFQLLEVARELRVRFWVCYVLLCLMNKEEHGFVSLCSVRFFLKYKLTR
jgi:hypothetical protein